MVNRRKSKPTRVVVDIGKDNDSGSTILDDDDEETFEVEHILSKKIDISGQVSYLIKWKGYPDDKNTWEPEENCSCDTKIRSFEQTIEQVQRKRNKINDQHPKGLTNGISSNHVQEIEDLTEERSETNNPRPSTSRSVDDGNNDSITKSRSLRTRKSCKYY